MQLIFWLAFFLLWAVWMRAGLRIREALLAAQVVQAVLIVFFTEILSVFQALALWPLVACWSTVVLVGLVLVRRIRARTSTALPSFPSLNVWDILILTAVGVIVSVTGVIALVAPPNNYDSMIYHMSRVAHWAANATVDNYPTHILLQLMVQPFAEYAILQTYILGGADYWASLAQWNAMLASLVGVSLLAEMLGGNRRGQLLAVLFTATLPMGILQSSGTQNDYLATLWAVCVAVFALLLIKTGRRRWGVLCALAFALATFTKALAVIVAVPFLLWALLRVRWSVRQKIALAFFVLAVVLAVNAAFLHRMAELSPHPFQEMKLVGKAGVDCVDVRGILSSAVRGVATQLALPSDQWNAALLSAVQRVHAWIGLDVNDPRFTVPGGPFLLWLSAPVLEDLATNPVHSWVYLFSVCSLLWLAVYRLINRAKSQREDPPGRVSVLSFTAALALAVLLFCALVKWQVWISRFHLPFFVLFSAAAAVTIVGRGSKLRSYLASLVAIGMCIGALLPLLFNQQRSLLPSGALTKAGLSRSVERGGEIFDWLQRNGYFREKEGRAGYLNMVTAEMRGRLKAAYPAEYETVWSLITDDTLSFSRGLFYTSQEELIFGRFGKVLRDDLSYNVRFIRRQLQRDNGCREIGFLSGVIEYPLWSLLRSDGFSFRIEHIMVDNASGRLPYPRGEPEPCLIVQEGTEGPATMDYRGRIYQQGTYGPYLVYVDETILLKGNGR